MSRFPLHLRHHHRARDKANVDHATSTTEEEPTYHNTPAGDTRKLRGIPTIAKGVQGAIPGTTPHQHH